VNEFAPPRQLNRSTATQILWSYTMNEETLRFLIEQKTTFINTAVNACMLWWVSSIVFCGSVLAAVWMKRDELRKERFMRWTGAILSIFFLAIACFGFLAIYFIGKGKTEISSLAVDLKYQGDFFGTELEAFQLAMWLGALSFLFVFVVWLFMWRWLSKGVQVPESKQPTQFAESE
jgi:hypothetical protein